MPPAPWATKGGLGSTIPIWSTMSKSGDVLLLDDGRTVFDVLQVRGKEILCRNRHDGELSNNKGINKQGGGLTAPALTAKDMEDIRTAASLGIDYVAVSFPKSGDDMRLARALLQAAGSNALLVAKIERVEAIENLDNILEATDGVMVARGDLAVEVGDAAVPALQKRIIRTAREFNKFAITATQMMESMIHSPVPTRAEVSDVANAVLDGTDAVMLSAETATGDYPVQTVEAMVAHLRRGREVVRFPARHAFPESRIHPHRPVDRHGRAVRRAPPEGQGDRLTDGVRFDRFVDVAPQYRHSDLRPDPGSADALQGEHFQGGVSGHGAAKRTRSRPDAV
jgi:pyruvate kinase